jgi:cytochrome c-type biogenesis protein CcmH/NrfG
MTKKRTARRLKNNNNKTLRSLYLSLFALFILVLAGLNLIVYFSPQKTFTIQAKDNTPLLQTYYLKNLLASHPTYREGWIALAKLEYSLGNMTEVQNAITKVREIDPNDKELLSLQALLTSK